MFVLAAQVLCSTYVEDHCNTGKDPFRRRLLCAKLRWEDKIRPPGGHTICWAYVDVLVLSLCHHACLAIDHWHLHEHLFRLRIVERIRGSIPPGTLQKHASNISTILRMRVDLGKLTLRHLGDHLELVQLQALYLATQLL